jgi:hypothetical protein
VVWLEGSGWYPDGCAYADGVQCAGVYELVDRHFGYPQPRGYFGYGQ